MSESKKTMSKCKACFQEINPRQSKCHHCGTLLRGSSLGRMVIIIGLLMGLAVLAIIGLGLLPN